VQTFPVNSLIDNERALEKPSNPRRRVRRAARRGLSALLFICGAEEIGPQVQLSTQSRSSNWPTTLHLPDGACAGAIVASYRSSAILAVLQESEVGNDGMVALADPADSRVRGARDVAVGTAAEGDRLRSAWHQPRNVSRMIGSREMVPSKILRIVHFGCDTSASGWTGAPPPHPA
jgi:hypothetical protein